MVHFIDLYTFFFVCVCVCVCVCVYVCVCACVCVCVYVCRHVVRSFPKLYPFKLEWEEHYITYLSWNLLSKVPTLQPHTVRYRVPRWNDLHVGSTSYTKQFMERKIQLKLGDITKTQPHAARVAFTHVLCTKWNYVLHVTNLEDHSVSALSIASTCFPAPTGWSPPWAIDFKHCWAEKHFEGTDLDWLHSLGVEHW